MTVDNTPPAVAVTASDDNTVASVQFQLDGVNLSADNHTFRFQITGRNAASLATDYQVAIDSLTLSPQ